MVLVLKMFPISLIFGFFLLHFFNLFQPSTHEDEQHGAATFFVLPPPKKAAAGEKVGAKNQPAKELQDKMFQRWVSPILCQVSFFHKKRQNIYSIFFIFLCPFLTSRWQT